MRHLLVALLAAAALVVVAAASSAPRLPAPPVIAAAGDIACGVSDEASGDPTQCQEAATASLVGSIRGLKAVLPLGDLQYPCGATSDFDAVYAKTWGRFFSISHPVPGNHEYDDGAGCGGSTADGYFAYWGARAGSPGRGWYSWNLGGWHLIALNSNCDAVGGCGAGSAQELWLRGDLARHRGACTLAYWHHARWSSGHHGDTPDVDALWRDLYAAHADLVLNGHDHSYERFARLGATGQPDPRGLLEVIVGAGGKSFYTLPAPRPAVAARVANVFGVLRLTLRPGRYDGSFLTVGGGVRDRFSGTCIR